jgi:hypothetical protein
MLVQEYSLYLCCFSLLQLSIAVNVVTRVQSLPSSAASPSSNYLLLSILLQEYTLYLQLLLLPPPTTCCCQFCYKSTLFTSTFASPSSNHLLQEYTFICCLSLHQLTVAVNVTRILSSSTCYFSLPLPVAVNAVKRIHYLLLLLLSPPTTYCCQCCYKSTLSTFVASPSSKYLLLSMLLQEYNLYLHLLPLPPPTTCCCQCCYKNTLSTSTCCFSLLQLPVAVNAVTIIHSLPTPVASPFSKYLLLAMMLGEYTLYLHLLLPSPSTNCCCQCC